MVASLSQAKETLSTDCFEQLAEQRKVTEEKVVQIGELQRKLKNAKQQLTAVKKEGDTITILFSFLHSTVKTWQGRS